MASDTSFRPKLGWRDRYNLFIDRHEVAWELLMAALTIAFVVVGYADEDPVMSGSPEVILVEWILTLVLAAEFVTRVYAARDRRAYLRGHWIDAIALVPPARGFRLLRLVRLLRLIRAFAGVYRALVRIERFSSNRQLIWLFMTWLGVAFICASALYLAEEGVNPNMTEPFDALWWGVVTLTTVGYGDIYPVTTEGRVAAGALMILGITLFAAITATITSRILAEEATARREDDTFLLQRLAVLRQDGVLTEDEFTRKKAEVLQRL